MISLDQHNGQVANVSQVLQSREADQKVVLNRKKSAGHSPRIHDYKKGTLQIDLSDFDRVINVFPIDPDALSNDLRQFVGDRPGELHAVVDTQAMVTMESLVDALLPEGLIPCVVPEFKGITVGGSIQGLAGESTSFKCGFFHDCVIGFEALLATGEVLWCSPNSNSELFYSIPGSFGSVAFITRAQLLCMKAATHVRLKIVSQPNQQTCAAYMSQTQGAILASPKSANNLHFLEAIGYGPDSFAAVEGVFETCESKKCKAFNIGMGSKWFFNQVKDCLDESEAQSINISTKDYLFRHDRGTFWMASYRIPQGIGRWMGSLLDSSNLYRISLALPRVFPPQIIVLQDFVLPADTVSDFFQIMQETINVWPVWLLPMRNFHSSNKSSIFAGPPDVKGHYCNIGVYGIPNLPDYPYVDVNRELERLLHRFQGRKIHYGTSFYDRDFFYNTLYEGSRYRGVREAYGATGILPEIFDKVSTTLPDEL